MEDKVSLSSLPDEIIYTIAEFMDFRSLKRLACTSHKMHDLIDSEIVWRDQSLRVVGANLKSKVMQNRTKAVLSMKDRCIIGRRWMRGRAEINTFVKYLRCMPCLRLEENHLFCSSGKFLIRFNRDFAGRIGINRNYKVAPHGVKDVSKFVIMDDEVICAGRDGSIARLNKYNFKNICSTYSKEKELTSIDAKNKVILTGSLRGVIQVWLAEPTEVIPKKDVNIGDRVFSLAIMPSNKYFIAGFPGLDNIDPLQLFDLERGKYITSFGEFVRKGAGILDIYPEQEHIFLTCGYDTTVRLWDTRAPQNSVAKWTDPYNNAIYSVKSDNFITIVSGANRNGIVHLWDKRASRRQHIYYGSFDSPTYCVAFDATNIFAAYDRGVEQFSFL